jgi:alkylation response protein AidB-like acyl-CoA dehydrogenase
MDFNFSAEEEAFRQKVRGFLAEHLPKGWGTGGFRLPEGTSEIEFARQWQRTLNDHGLLGLSWPKEYGGHGASQAQLAIFNEEMARIRAPGPLNGLGLIMAGPVLMVHGTEEQKKRFLPKILSCEEVWCQLFSEPNSGSDLASLRTRGELVGDEFIVNGQKIWTTMAQISDWGMLLVRSDTTAPKHRGISYLLVDMHSPGITVRPLRQITGGAEFNEVFFENVRVPRANLVGGLHEGWRVASTTLSNERGTSALGVIVNFQNLFEALVDLTRRTKRPGGAAAADPLIRQRLAQFYVDLQELRYTAYRSLTKVLRGETPGPEGSITKLNWSELSQRMHDFAMETLGPASQLVKGSKSAVQNGRWQFNFLASRSATIAAGTSEVQRNAIAERILGLPKAR